MCSRLKSCFGVKLQDFQIQVDDSGELVVMNPPVVEAKRDIETSVQ